MRVSFHRLISVMGLIIALSLSALAQTDTNEGTDESELLDRVRRLEEQQQQSLDREISAIKEELNKLERAAVTPKAENGEAHQKRSAPGVVSDNRWRFKYHQGRWWYWMPDKQWVYWSNSRWLRLPYSAAGAQSVVVRVAERSDEAESAQTSNVSKGDHVNRDASGQKSKATASARSNHAMRDVKRRDSSNPGEKRPEEKSDGATRAR